MCYSITLVLSATISKEYVQVDQGDNSASFLVRNKDMECTVLYEIKVEMKALFEVSEITQVFNVWYVRFCI